MGLPIVLLDGLDDTELDPVGAVHTDLGCCEGPGYISEEFTQFHSGFRKDLEQSEGGVDGVVIAEIPVGEEDMSAHLSCEERLLFFHFPLDQRVTGLPHDRPSSVLRDVVVERLRAFDLADDRCAGILSQYVAGKEEEQLVAPENFSAVGDHTEPVGITVVRYTGVSLLGADETDQLPEIFRDSWIGEVVGEAAVRIAVQIGHMATVAAEDGESKVTSNPVASVNDHFQPFSDRDIPEKIVLVCAGDLLSPNTSFIGSVGLTFNDPPQFLDVLAIDRIRSNADLEAVEVRRIVASRNHDAAVDPEVADREIEHRGSAQADIDDIHTSSHDTSADGILIGLRAETAVAT